MNYKYKNFPSINELRNICQLTNEESWYGKVVARKISIYFTAFFIRFNTNPNALTMASMIVGAIGSMLLLSGELAAVVAGLVMFQLWIILDCSDGEVARYSNRCSKRGVFLDNVGHYVVDPLFFLPITIKLYNNSCSDCLFFGIVIMLSLILMRYVLKFIPTTALQKHNIGYIVFARKIVSLIYTNVTIMLITSLVVVIDYLKFLINLDISSFAFILYFYATTYPIIITGITIYAYRIKKRSE